jgi:pilus assembly protein CpaB
MNRRRVLGTVAAVALAGVGAIGLVSWANSTKDSAEAAQAQTAVLIVDKLIPKGATAATILDSTHVGTVQQKSLASGAITSDGQVGTLLAAADMYPGEQVVKDRLVAQLDNGIPADKVQVAVTLTPERAIGGAVKSGDTVGVYLSFEPFDTNKPESDTTTPKKTPNTTHLTFQHVLVTNVQTTDEPVSESKDDGLQQVSAKGYIVTLALSPAQSEQFVFGTEFGHVWLSNEPATVSQDGTSVVTLGSVYMVVP